MSVISIRTAEQLNHNMKLSQSNHDVLELVREKWDLPTLNAALSKIIEISRPFFKRSSRAVKMVNKNKKVCQVCSKTHNVW